LGFIKKLKSLNLQTLLQQRSCRFTGRKLLDELNQRLATGNFSETSGDDSWQKWIYKHNWLFGVNYQEPIQKVKITSRE